MMTEEQRNEFFSTLKNPRWTRPSNEGPILLDGEFNGGKMEFYASPNDLMSYGKEIYQKAIEGTYGKIAPYQEPEHINPILPHIDPVKKE